MTRSSVLAGLVVMAVLATACGSNVLALEVGECFDDPQDGASLVTSVEIVDCAQPHDNEVYAVVAYPEADGSYPGDEAVFTYAEETCIAQFDVFVDFAYVDSELDLGYFWPTEESWDAGDRQVQCFVYELDVSQVTGTLRGAGR